MNIIDNFLKKKGTGKASRAPKTPEEQKRAEARSERELGLWYLRQARDFENSKEEGDKARYQMAMRFAGAFAVIAVLSVIGMAGLGLLKRPNPPAVLRVNDTTGAVTVLPTTANGKITWGERADRADLRRYVEARESYDWETINDLHNMVMVMSGAREKTIYDTWVRGPASPLKFLKDQARVIAKVGVITFVGDTAQVFFSKTTVPLNPGNPRTTEYWVATVSYTHDDIPEQTTDQDVDPTAFRALSYRVDRDLSRAPADGTAAAGTQKVSMGAAQ
jgi:type IV secretion system protein VirB8